MSDLETPEQTAEFSFQGLLDRATLCLQLVDRVFPKLSVDTQQIRESIAVDLMFLGTSGVQAFLTLPEPEAFKSVVRHLTRNERPEWLSRVL